MEKTSTTNIEYLSIFLTSWGVTPEHILYGFMSIVILVGIYLVYNSFKNTRNILNFRKSINVGDECKILYDYPIKGEIIEKLDNDDYIVKVKTNIRNIYPIK